MNEGERNNRDPRRGLPSVAERRKTNIPLEDDVQRELGQREMIERTVNDFGHDSPSR